MMQAEVDNVTRPGRLSDSEFSPAVATTALSPRAVLGERRSGIRQIRIPFTRGEFIIEIEGAPPAWVMPTIQSLGELLDLPRGWDSYRGEFVDPRCVDAALDILLQVMRDTTPQPSVVPTSKGGIQLEWHTKGVDLELEFTSPMRVRGFFEDHRNAKEWEADLSFDLTKLTDAINTLSKDA